jgi:hypothetical protein
VLLLVVVRRSPLLPSRPLYPAVAHQSPLLPSHQCRSRLLQLVMTWVLLLCLPQPLRPLRSHCRVVRAALMSRAHRPSQRRRRRMTAVLLVVVLLLVVVRRSPLLPSRPLYPAVAHQSPLPPSHQCRSRLLQLAMTWVLLLCLRQPRRQLPPPSLTPVPPQLSTSAHRLYQRRRRRPATRRRLRPRCLQLSPGRQFPDPLSPSPQRWRRWVAPLPTAVPRRRRPLQWPRFRHVPRRRRCQSFPQWAPSRGLPCLRYPACRLCLAPRHRRVPFRSRRRRSYRLSLRSYPWIPARCR